MGSDKVGNLHRIIVIAVAAILLAGVADAQTVRSEDGEPPSGPGWSEFRDLSARLEALEAENRWLKDSITSTYEPSDATYDYEPYCDSCGQGCCGAHAVCENASWIDQMCSRCKQRLSWNKGPVRIVPFGYFAADMIGSERAYTLLGAPLFLLSALPPDVPDSRFTVTGQQSTLGFDIAGPNCESFASGGRFAFNFFGDRPVQNNPGLFFLIGYLELQNDQRRFWAGQDLDAIGRQNTNSPSWTSHKQSGNFGNIRPGFRVERYFHHSDLAQTSLYFGLTQQVVLDFIANPLVAGTDNGWPNVEMRWELALGEECNGQRPIQLAVGGVVGETRAVDLAGQAVANVSATWGVIPEMHLQLGRWGFQGEAFVGEAIGTYNAGIGQSLDPFDDEPIYTIGGFGELYCNIAPSFTVSIGYGIDNPRNADLGPEQRSRNETYWINSIWRSGEHWETRFEISHMETDYIFPFVDSFGMLYHVDTRYKF